MSLEDVKNENLVEEDVALKSFKRKSSLKMRI